MLQTSGAMVTATTSGGLVIEYCDYSVDEFGGGDYEARYSFNSENAAKLLAALNAKDERELKTAVIDKFGKDFNVCEFEKFCHSCGIEYDRTSWF